MANKAFLIPKRGLTVRDPLTLQALPAEGAEVNLTPYWTRRVADGDVRRREEAKPSKSTTAKNPQE